MPNASSAPSSVTSATTNHGPDDEPQAFIIWNHQIQRNFVYADEGSSTGASCFSTDGQILPISDSGETLPEELECSELKPKGPFYNIVQNRMNLSEKRGPKYLCHECRYPLHTRLSMVTHMKMHLRPFCEACFAVFDSKEAVHSHIRATHPEVVLGESKDFYSLQTVAPPNTPTPLSDDEMKAIEGLVNPIVKYPFSFQQEDTEGDVTNEDEPRLVIDDAPRPAQRGRPRKNQQSPAVVKKSLKKKKVKKIKVVEDSTPDSVMKKITSRFGRSISLKMPQF